MKNSSKLPTRASIPASHTLTMHLDTDEMRWEDALAPGDAVLVAWGYGSSFRAWGVGTVEKVNRKSFQVRLVEDVPHGDGVGWPAGHVLKGICRRTAWERWNGWDSVHPLPEVSEK